RGLGWRQARREGRRISGRTGRRPHTNRVAAFAARRSLTDRRPRRQEPARVKRNQWREGERWRRREGRRQAWPVGRDIAGGWRMCCGRYLAWRTRECWRSAWGYGG